MNSAMMPADGFYYASTIDKREFISILKREFKKGNLESYIGYQQNIDFLKKWTGLDIPINRTTTTIKDGDILLVMKLTYRPEANLKGNKVNEEDFVFSYVTYQAPMVSRAEEEVGNVLSKFLDKLFGVKNGNQ